MADSQPRPEQSNWRAKLLAKHPWLTYVLPLAVFLVLTTLEPKPPEPAAPAPAAVVAADAPLPFDPEALAENEVKPDAEPQPDKNETQPKAGWFGVDIPYRAYPLVYSVKLALVAAAMWFVLPGYRQFPWRFSPLSVIVGVVGVFVWVGLCHLQLEQKLLPKIGLGFLVDSGQRSAFNPLVELAANPLAAYGFLAIRFIGLALIVPVIEEFFLRGFLMRIFVHENWNAVPFGSVNAAAVAAGTIMPMLMHPSELVAAAVWFTMVTLLMVRTRNIWDCVIAHAVTNLLLGVYVVTWNQWHLM
ncbi:MAG TPA: CAAX prenyl protease-related protein [Pirellulales bacterium]|jgi:hypothetical protein